MARRNTLRKIGKALAVVCLILLGGTVGYYAYLNQEVVTYYVEKTMEFFLGNSTAGEWLHLYVKASATFKAPRYALKGSLSLGKSATVYVINSTKVTNYIRFQVSVTINYQNLESVSVNCKIHGKYVDENNQLQDIILLDETWNPSASGQSHSFTYDLKTGTSMWSSFAGYDVTFYYYVVAQGYGSLTGDSYSDEGGENIVRGTINEGTEQFSGTVSGSYSIQSLVASTILSDFKELVSAFVGGFIIGVLLTAISPVKPDMRVRIKVTRREK